MSPKSSQFVLFALIALILLGAGLLYAFRQNAADYLNEQSNLATTTAMVSAETTESLDLEIFKSKKLVGLKENIINFNFDNICYRPAGIVATPVLVPPAPGTDTGNNVNTAVTPVSCRRGNDLPFVIKVDK